MMNRRLCSWPFFIRCTILLSIVLLVGAVNAQAQPALSKAFISDSIGPGSVSTLTFTINNSYDVPVTDLAFTDNLPAGMFIASPANADSTCGGTLSAPAGGTVITFSDGTIGPGATGLIVVNVTCANPGTYDNVSGELTSSAGNSGTAGATLIVETDRPGFSKSFTPTSLPRGGRSTLTFTIDNSANSSSVSNLAFVDNLPVGMAVASPANISITGLVNGMVTAVPGSSIIAYNFSSYGAPNISALTAGTISVDVIATAAGMLGNTSGELMCATVFGSPLTCGKAGAELEVTSDPLGLMKSFSDDPVPPGGTVTLEFTVTNSNRDFSATNISFSDDLEAVLSGLVATGLPLSDVCGSGSVLSGSAGDSLITLTGGNLAPGASATFSVTLQVPGDAAIGFFGNMTSSIIGEVDGNPVSGSPASETLFVSPAPLLTKSFTDDPVGAGGQVTLEFTITNPSPISTAENITFTDDFAVILPTAVSLPADGFCGPGSTATFTPLFNPRPPSSVVPARLSISGGTLDPLLSSTFSVVLDVAGDAPSGIYPNLTSEISAEIGGQSYNGAPALDSLLVVGAPTLLKSFTDDPVLPGAAVTLEFTLTNHDTVSAATDISFTDDLAAVMPGFTALGLPLHDVCGTGSVLSGTTNLTLTGGNLAAGDSATFNVTLQTPPDAPLGTHINTTSNVSATLGGVVVEGVPASDDLVISSLTLSKEFIDDPVIPGDNLTLRFGLANSSLTEAATSITFIDDLGDVLNGLSAVGLPLSDICGVGSSLVPVGDLLFFSGGSLAAGDSCQFDVTLAVPAGTASDTYSNLTQSFSATIGGATVALENAADELVVNSNLIGLSKAFIDDPVAPGSDVTLEFTLTNLDSLRPVTGISFTDDLGAMLPGLVAIDLPATDICGPGSQISGTDLLTFTGGTLDAGGSCSFQVSLAIPAGAATGTYTNVCSPVNGQIGGFMVDGDAAAGDLLLQNLAFSKSFNTVTLAGGTPTLTFTIENLDTTSGVDSLAFADDLSAVLSGLVATGLPLSDVCGPGSSLSGTSVLTLTGGSLAPGESSTFVVSLQVPATTEPGTYSNISSELTSAGITVASPAQDSLVVVHSPTLSKSFIDDSVVPGATVTLEFTLTNNDSIYPVTEISFTDDLGAVLSGLVATGLPLSDICGPGSSLSGTSVLTLTGGNLAPGESSTFVVPLQVPATADPGTYSNITSELTSAGIAVASPAQDDLTVTDSDQIPTLTEWGLIVLMVILTGAALLTIRRRRLFEF